MIIGIVAVDQNLAIGKQGKLPWHYPADMKFFKAMTVGNSVVMGRRTWLTLTGPLKNRQNLVLTRDATFQSNDPVIVMRDLNSVLEFAANQDSHLFVIGGAEVYRSFAPHIERWIVTEVPLAVAGADTFMPDDFLTGFEPTEVRQLDKDLRATIYDRQPA